MYQFQTEHFLPISIEEAWDFFSSPKNLSKITPVELDFQILTDLDDKEIYDGMKIAYTVRPMLGIKVYWETKIHDVTQHQRFTDTQIKGPYKVWEHTHVFKQIENGIMMFDSIDYEIPFGIFGKFAHRLFVKKKIEGIFDFRKQVLNNIFQIN
jgi:ligand-binding SRPBCC domain-containing protein